MPAHPCGKALIDSAGAYWPWVQVIRSYTGAVGTAAAAEQMGYAGTYVAEVLPELRASLGEPSHPPLRIADEKQARFAIFDAGVAFWKNAAAARPLLLVFDDLHAASVSSLLMLQLLARDLRVSRILVVGTLSRRRGPPLAV